ncbi:MAG: hypothetical protein H7A39_03075 [Chlamydiales bacterium]|nr:hypothetical protein [Chlamydiales bacterium]
MRPKKCLLITSSGGGGHLEAAKAKAHELREKDTNLIIVQRDILLDWLGKPLGGLLAGCWNFAQKRGDVAFQKVMIHNMYLVGLFIWLPIFLHAFFLIYRQDVDLIIDTQPNGTSAIVTAIILAEKCKKLSRRYEKILVDLPTDKAGHYFKAVKKLRPKKRAIIHFITTKPLLQKGQTEEEFWEKHTGLPLENIIYSHFPLRPKFKNLDPLPKHESCTIAPKIPSDEEWTLIQAVLDKGHLDYDYCAPYLDITIPPNAHVSTLMLGSQPAKKATQAYVKSFIQLKTTLAMHREDLLFVFCRSHRTKKSLLNQVCDLITNLKKFPNSLTIIPLTFQDDTVIAPLFARSDATLTRSGGITSMELLSIMQGQIWIHSESKKPHDLLHGIPFWEKGNAKYLEAEKNAVIITPELFPTKAQNYFTASGLADKLA